MFEVLGAQRRHPAGVLVGRAQPVRPQRCDHFLHEERVAPGRFVAGVGESCAHRLAERLDQERGDCSGAQRRQFQTGRDLVAHELIEGPGFLTGAPPSGDHDRHGEVLQPVRQVLQEPDRGVISELQVVHHYQQRPPRSHVRRQPEEPVQKRIHIVTIGAPLPGVLPLEQRQRESCCARENPFALFCSGRAEPSLEQLERHTEREVLLLLRAPGAQGCDPDLLRSPPCPEQQP